jgi:hypothetical protein
VPLAATASDDDKVTKVIFTRDGVPIGTAVKRTRTWTVSWPTTNRADGCYLLRAVAFDPAGNRGQSDPVLVLVRNGHPTGSRPVPDIGTTTATSGVAPVRVGFSDQSSGGRCRMWAFGDGTTSFDAAPAHVYRQPGQYSVTLTAWNAVGSASTVRSDVVSVTPYVRAGRRSGATRVLIVGDSLTYQSGLPGKAMFAAAGYDAFIDGVAGSGLLDADRADGTWLDPLVALLDPDIVVIEFVGNYRAETAVDPSVERGSPAFLTQWQAAAQRLVRHAAVRGAAVDWVLSPPMLTITPFAFEPFLNAGYRALIGVGLIDAFTPFGGPGFDADYRGWDSVHLNDRGSALLSMLELSGLRHPITMTGVDVAPLAALTAGDSEPVSATVTWSDGGTGDVSAIASWTTGDRDVAVVQGTHVTGVAAGTTTVSATAGAFAGDTGLRVRPA